MRRLEKAQKNHRNCAAKKKEAVLFSFFWQHLLTSTVILRGPPTQKAVGC